MLHKDASVRHKIIRVKATALGATGLIMLASKSVAIKLILAHALVVKGVLLSIITALPTIALAQNSVIYVSDESGQIETYTRKGTSLDQQKIKKFTIQSTTSHKSASQQLKEHLSSSSQGTTTLKGIDDLTDEQEAQLKKERRQAEIEANRSVGKTTLQGEQHLSDQALQELRKKRLHEQETEHKSIGKTTLRGIDDLTE